MHAELNSDSAAVTAAEVGGEAQTADGLQATYVKDRFILVLQSFTDKGRAVQEARELWAAEMDPRVYEARNGRFAVALPAASSADAERLRVELIKQGIANTDAYISGSTNLRTRWLFDSQM